MIYNLINDILLGEKKLNCSINLGKWNNIFVVPSEIVENYIKKASESQIKVILYLLCNRSKIISEKEISKDLNISESEVIGAVKYWESEGYLLCEKGEQENLDLSREQSAENPEKDAISNMKKVSHLYHRPDNSYIARRIQSSNEINLLMQEAQVILGRPISNGDSAVLLMLHDNEGLPVDVILMLLQYAVSVGKIGMKYIEKTGSGWALEGIDNIEKAEKKILKLHNTQILWKRFENIIGIEHRAPTKFEEEAVNRWFDEWKYSDEMIKESYDRCVNSNGKYILKYMDSIVKRWHNEGITKIEQALVENTVRKNKRKKVYNTPSYDIDEYEKYNILDYI